MSRPLKIYMRGKSVTQLQNMLKQMGYPMNDVQGVFGASTRDGVRDFQKRKGLKTTGVVDNDLFTLMQQNVGFQAEEKKVLAPSQTSQTDSDRLDTLIRLLVNKGLISEEEVEAAMQNSEPAKVSGKPLF